MLLLRPALWTLDDKDQVRAASLGYMEYEEPQSSMAPADTVAYHPASRQDGLSLAGMELFASVDMDALMGSTATVSAAQPAAATEPPPISGLHPGHAFPTLALGEGMAHAAEAKPGQVASHMPPDTAALTMLPAINIVMTQNPAISVARPGQPGLVPRQPGLALMPIWASTSVPLPASRELTPSSSMREVPLASASGGSEASASRSRPQPQRQAAPVRRSMKAAGGGKPAPEAKAQNKAAARARNARNQQLHRQRQKDLLGKYQDLSATLKAKFDRLTMETAGLRAHNEALLEAESGNAEPDQGRVEEIWGLVQPELRPQHTAMHEKLAAVFSCISTGCGRKPVSADDVARMSAEEIFSFRRQYGNRVRQLLHEGAEAPSSTLHAELLRLVALWNVSEAHMWEHCPKTTHRFIAFAQHLDDRKGVNAAAKWHDILVRLELDARQVEALKGIHTRMTDQLLNVTAERLHVSNMLQDTIPRGQNVWLASRTFLDVRNTQRRLTASVAHEHEVMRAAHTSFRQAISPVQQARLDVLAHPENFDIIALLHQLTVQPTASMPA